MSSVTIVHYFISCCCFILFIWFVAIWLVIILKESFSVFYVIRSIANGLTERGRTSVKPGLSSTVGRSKAVRQSSVHYWFIPVRSSVYDVVSFSPVLCQCIWGKLVLSLFFAVSSMQGPYDVRHGMYYLLVEGSIPTR